MFWESSEATMLASWCTLTLILISVFATVVQGGRCNGATSPITIDADGGTLYSSGYPQHYENSDSCGWLLTAGSSDQVVQLEVLDMDLELEKETCVDVLTVYDGSTDKSPVLKTWCGTSKAFLKSTGPSLLLKFESSPLVTRKGFAIAYHQIKPYDLSCEEGSVTTLSIGTSPVLYHFNHLENNASECQWRFDAKGSERLVLTTIKATGSLPCGEGYFALHDGVDDSAPEVLHWCDSMYKNSNPFAAFYPSGSALVTMYVDRKKKEYYSFELFLKVQTRPAQESCDSSNLAVFELQEDEAPVIMALHYVIAPGGARCPVKFHSRQDLRFFRVDLLAENGQVASCSSSAVSVYSGGSMNSSSSLKSECWRDRRPIFLSNRDTIIIDPLPGKTSVVQIIPADYTCVGWPIEESTFRHNNGKLVIPRKTSDSYETTGFKNYCILRYLFEAFDEGDHPRVNIEGQFEDWDGGDFITVYNGNSTHDPVLKVVNHTDYIMDSWVVGSGRQMLLEFSSDAVNDRGYITLKYSSVPVSDFCLWDQRELKATAEPQNLTSPNYPGYFPIDNVCQYMLTTDTYGDVIHLEVLDGDLGTHCDNNLRIYNGDSAFSDKLGIVCRGNPHYPAKMESEKETMLIVFTSSEDGNFGDGWKVRYYSAPPTPPEDGDSGLNTTAIVAAVMGIIILVLIILVICFAVKLRRREMSLL